MNRCERSARPVLLIRGGVFLRPDEEHHEWRERNDELLRIAALAGEDLLRSGSALDVVCRAIEELERSPLFNAGYGSELQRDGIARLSASLMESERERFSGVALATNIIHPIRLARALQEESDRVLGPSGAALLQKRLGIPDEDPVTTEMRRRWESRRLGSPEGMHGTVGAVALDSKGRLAAGTSTGGRGFESVERMSDVCSVAGNYATRFAATSCTGIGEEIVDIALAARIEERVRDGKPLEVITDGLLRDAALKKLTLGWISLTHLGEWSASASNTTILGARISPELETPQLFTTSGSSNTKR